MGSRATAAKMRLPQGVTFTAQEAQGGKEQQVGQPAQSQRRGEAQMEKVGHKHRRTAGQIEQRILSVCSSAYSWWLSKEASVVGKTACR